MHTRICNATLALLLAAAPALVTTAAQAGERPEATMTVSADTTDAAGLMGVQTHAGPSSDVRKALQAQASQPPRGGELSDRVVVKTLQRLSDSFDQPIPEQLKAPSRGPSNP
ncbi:hypothetical protein [Marinobacter sp. C2H3]|uniref:hypothetical protein n=1 Tax=Marinobacter sp. C2H3 TaxID=3119003 RepID=UPI00300EBBDB